MTEDPFTRDDGAWQQRRVFVFNGQHDTRTRTGGDYQSVEMAGLFTMEPARCPKANAPAFIPSSYCKSDAREHKVQRERGSFVALTGDVDSGNHSLQRIEALVRQLANGGAWLIYSSAHATSSDMRWRIIVPLAQPLGFGEWNDAQTAFFDFMEAGGVVMDRALARAAQPSYLPNVPLTHHKTGEALRGPDARPLYFATSSSGIERNGLRIAEGPMAKFLTNLHRRRADEEQFREELRAHASRRRVERVASNSNSIIEVFNEGTTIADLLARYGYEQSPRGDLDWRSPHQTSTTYATRIIENKWVSLSSSDAAAGLGARSQSGCYGDAFDLLVHYEHSGDLKRAWRQICLERERAGFARTAGLGTAPEPPGQHPDDPGWQEVPPLGDGFGPEAEDFQDERAVSSAGQRAHSARAEPVDLWARYEPTRLQVGLLPSVIEQFAFQQGELMGVDPGGLAMAALAVCSAAIPDRLQVQVKEHDPYWRESARLWVALIGTPSSKKSPIMAAAVRPLNRIDGQLFAEWSQAKAAHEALPSKERKDAEVPRQRRLRISDATIEAAQEVLKDSPDGVLSVQDELSGWFGAMDKYAAGKGAMADRGFWLQAYNGGQYAVNRVGRGSALIQNLSISVLGGIQPEPLRRIVNEAVDDGLIQRLIPVPLCLATVGVDAPRCAAVGQYEELVGRLWQLPGAINCSLPPFASANTDAVLRFAPEAQLVRRELEKRHFEMMQTEIISPKMASHFGKYDGLFARLCLVWHCVENASVAELPLEISGRTASLVAEFLHTYIQPNAVAFYVGMLGLADDHERLVELAAYILSRRLKRVQARDLQRATKSLRSLTADQSRRLCEKLESLGWLEPIDSPPNSRTAHWAVNPLTHEMFEERGRQEAERREKAREAIRNVFAS